MSMKPFHAIAAAATVALTALAGTAPASAGGFSFTLTPKGKDAEVIGTGLRLYSFAQGFKNKAKVDQKGSGNGAAVSQRGNGNTVGVFQRGKNNSATAAQNGNYNALGIFQFGKGNATTATQNGNGNVGLIFQGRW
jgi:hypothetical protein